LQSEPHHQQQNPADRRYQTIKRAANHVLDCSGAPNYTWLLCLQYVCYLLNHAFNVTLKGIPLQLLSGISVDFIPLLQFHFWQKVYYKRVDSGFPSDSVEIMGHVVGISKHCGHGLTYNAKTLKVFLAKPDDLNVRAELLRG
jgi:hypothetical protein